jgi:transcriptional regulator with XRE-family HTH domain
MARNSKLALAGEILRNLRLEYGMTQKEVAYQVGILSFGHTTLSERHYRRLEKGLMEPKIGLAIDIATVLDTDVYEIWG